jgi:AraC-like DNA-binding protein
MKYEASTLRFSTDKLPEPERGRAVRELYERELLPVRLAPIPDHAFRVDLTRRVLPDLGIMRIGFDGLCLDAGPEPTGNDDLCLGTVLAGSAIVSDSGREIAVNAGAAVIVTREHGGFNIASPTSGRFIALRMPRATIAPLVTNVDAAIMRVIEPNTGALTLLTKYVGAVAQERSLAATDLERLVATQIHDLVALTIGASRDGEALAKARGLRAARLRAIKADIATNLGDCNLRAVAVAGRLGVSPRYVHKLFEAEGTSFSAFVLGQRLAHAYRILIDPRFVHRPIGSIAFDMGFGDLSHFNHCFRRSYGATPSEVRSQAKADHR